MQAELAIQLLLSRVLHCKKKGYKNVALCVFCLLKNASLNIERFICSRLLMPYFCIAPQLQFYLSFPSNHRLELIATGLCHLFILKMIVTFNFMIETSVQTLNTGYIIQCWDFDFHGQEWFLILDDYPFLTEVILAYLFYCCSMAANSEMEKKV